VDVGGTKIAAGLVAFPRGQVLARRQIPTRPTRGGKPVLADVLGLCGEMIAVARGLNQHVVRIGLGVCELVDLDGNVVSENCIAWKGMPVRERLARLAPAVIEADVRAAALAEAHFGAGQGIRQLLYVTVGTGISCCLMLDGKPFTGAHGATGTLASSPLNGLCQQCGKVDQRTLEEIASGPALVARFNARRVGAARSGHDVLAAVAAGDSAAIEVVRSAGDALGSTVGLMANVLDPAAVIVGGGLGLSEGLFWDSFTESTRRHIWFAPCRDIPLLRAATGLDSGVIGAAAAAWRHDA